MLITSKRIEIDYMWKSVIVGLLFLSLSMRGQHQLANKYDLMPWPQQIKANENTVHITKDFIISIHKKEGRVYEYATNIIRRISNRTGVFINEGFPIVNSKKATVQVTFKEMSELKLRSDESYKLRVKKDVVEVLANTDIGALRGLETLMQLIDYNDTAFFFKGVEIEDYPRFDWRGLMIDVSRHFHPIEVLKRNIDAMASMKMNVFHWHLSDDQGFRVESSHYPRLHELGSDGFFYTKNQIKDLVTYADKRGIRVVPEIDVPGHATAILTAYPELSSKKDFTYEIERFSGIFNPTLNPIEPEVYVFLDSLFAEIAPLFPDEYFHIGGDENEGIHWDENKNIQKFKLEKGLKNNHELQTYFNVKLQKILKKYGKKLMGWDEIMTDGMPKSAIIHSWRGINEGFKEGTLVEAVKKGYQAVLSNDYYIDRVQSVDHHYLFDPVGDSFLTSEEKSRVLGGEVTMWSELVTPLTIDSRIWPRTAAIAERFWSPKKVKNLENMRKRLSKVSFQLEELGLKHYSFREQILRNISKSEEIESLKILTSIYEPLKIYTRNKGGTEYKTFSPFTLFADACTADASMVHSFQLLVDSYIKQPNMIKNTELQSYFAAWRDGYLKFKTLKKNPILNELEIHYYHLNKLSTICLEILQEKTEVTKLMLQDLEESIQELEKPLVDTELAAMPSIQKFFNSIKTNNVLK
ncbi:beta-N-acetylhexosaminidase [Tenacibaculum sp. C7A-26P2]|uniref:beta-N-acetylhexosaminidase n=1 Tax=Tenacibaculum sp. C7A-26P2 TaxID=3447504 RepID=UPI003F84CEEB